LPCCNCTATSFAFAHNTQHTTHNTQLLLAPLFVNVSAPPCGLSMYYAGACGGTPPACACVACVGWEGCRPLLFRGGASECVNLSPVRETFLSARQPFSHTHVHTYVPSSLAARPTPPQPTVS
jgi:hypothetical protein